MQHLNNFGQIHYDSGSAADFMQLQDTGQLPWQRFCNLIKAKNFVTNDGIVVQKPDLDLEKKVCAAIRKCESLYGALPSTSNHRCQKSKFEESVNKICNDKKYNISVPNCETDIKRGVCKSFDENVPYLPIYLKHFCLNRNVKNDKLEDVPLDIKPFYIDQEVVQQMKQKKELTQQSVLNLYEAIIDSPEMNELKKEIKLKLEDVASQIYKLYRDPNNLINEKDYYSSQGIDNINKANEQVRYRSLISYAKFPTCIPIYHFDKWKEFSTCLLAELYFKVTDLTKKFYNKNKDYFKTLNHNKIYEDAFILIKEKLNLVTKNDIKKLASLFDEAFLKKNISSTLPRISDVKLIETRSDGCYSHDEPINKSMSVIVDNKYAMDLLQKTVSKNLWNQ